MIERLHRGTDVWPQPVRKAPSERDDDTHDQVASTGSAVTTRSAVWPPRSDSKGGGQDRPGRGRPVGPVPHHGEPPSRPACGDHGVGRTRRPPQPSRPHPGPGWSGRPVPGTARPPGPGRGGERAGGTGGALRAWRPGPPQGASPTPAPVRRRPVAHAPLSSRRRPVARRPKAGGPVHAVRSHRPCAVRAPYRCAAVPRPADEDVSGGLFQLRVAHRVWRRGSGWQDRTVASSPVSFTSGVLRWTAHAVPGRRDHGSLSARPRSAARYRPSE